MWIDLSSPAPPIQMHSKWVPRAAARTGGEQHRQILKRMKGIINIFLFDSNVIISQVSGPPSIPLVG